MAGYHEDEAYPAPHRMGGGGEMDTRRMAEPHRAAAMDTRNLGPGPYRVPQTDTMNFEAPVRAQDATPPVNREQYHHAAGGGGGGTGTTPMYVQQQKAQAAGSEGRMPAWMLILSLSLRVAAALVLVVALAVLAANSKTSSGGTSISTTSFTSTKYALAVAIIGAIYSVYETLSMVVRLVSGRLLLPGTASLFVSYIGDQIIIVLLLTGGSAAAATVKDIHDVSDDSGNGLCTDLDGFCGQSAGGIAMIFIGFCFLAASLVLSSYCFYRKRT